MSPTCETCHGIGYVHRPGGEAARAAVCGCREDCPTCGGARYVVEEQGGYEVARPCPDCHAVHARVALFNDAQIPPGYGQKTLAGFVAREKSHDKVKTLAMRYQRTFELAESRGLLLVGPPGTGKTHILCALVAFLTLERGIACRFVDFFHLTSRIKATFDDPRGESQEDLIRPLVEVSVLAIDELGKGLGTVWEERVVDEIISRRYNAGRLILATSNYLPERMLEAAPAPREPARGASRKRPLGADSLEERIGLRAYSRLAELCEVVRIGGEDYRTRT